MGMSGAKFEVVKFDGTGNFGLWQTRVKDLLAQQGILKALPPQKSASMDDEDWEEFQQRAAGTIRLCLADEIMYHVMNLKSPGEEGFDLAQHVNVFNHIITDLARLDVSIEDEDREMILLCSLPFSYEHLVTTLTCGKETIKDRGRKLENKGSGKRNSRSKSRGKKTIHCYKCKEPGHVKRDCPKLKKQADEKRDDSSKSANMVLNDGSDCSDGDMLSVSTNQFVDAWILDSGCSYHITPNREWFTSYKSGNSGSVNLGDDRCCHIVGVGDVRIKMYDGTVRTLCDVRHIPELKKNLISLGTLHKNGFIPKADEDRETIRIVKGALTVMKGKITAGNIYKLLGSTVVGGVHSVSCDDNTKPWHMLLAHLSERGMTELHKRNLLHGVKSCKLDFCKFCVIEKQTKKSEVFAKCKLWKAEVENQTSRKIKHLRSDNSTEYTDSQFQKFCEEHGIQRHFSVRLPKSFWAEAVSMACYLINIFGGKVAEEVWTGNPVNFDHLRIFGCPAYVHVPSDERSKLDLKSKQCIFLGYKKGVKGYKFWDPVARKMVVSRDAVFDEQFMLQQHQDKMPKDSSSLDTLQMELELHPVAPENRGGSNPSSDYPVAVESGGSSLPTSGGSTTNELQAYNLARDRQRRTNVKPPSRLGYEDMVSFALLVSGDEPTTFHRAITS
ncbi:UNVERIFIED_CONTAM: Retrovirus-related Pol polyprotein from transposon TNT 1-94 [Sesamum latifolium]|uniref:Retrovirus-related Pol polyprotein from transposon TNT 1-94 n=1 Tax=Sesamum latifolium TaxID=2727402 RepID=A0AAW2XIB3_9LAMI